MTAAANLDAQTKPLHRRALRLYQPELPPVDRDTVFLWAGCFIASIAGHVVVLGGLQWLTDTFLY